MRRAFILAGLAALSAALSQPAGAGSRHLVRAAYGPGASPPSLPATPTPLPTLPLPVGAKVMVVGDSLSHFNNGANTAGSNGYAYGQASGPVEALWSIDPRFNFDSWYDPADPWKRGFNGANQGISGDHLDWANAPFGNGIYNRTRFDLARGPAIVWLNGGTNTINSGDRTPGPASAAYVIGKLDATIDQFTRRGVWVILSTLYPRGDWPDGDARHTTLRAVNDWIRAQTGRSGVRIMDPYDALVASTTDRDNVNSAYFSTDLVHPSVAGAWAIGNGYLKPILQDMIAPGSVFDQNPATSNLFPASAALLNGGTTGTKTGNVAVLTGSVATGCSLDSQIPIAASIEDAGSYKKQVLTITPSASGSGYDTTTLQVPAPSIPAGGSWMRAYVYVEAPDATSISLSRMTVEMRSSTDPTLVVIANFSASSTFATPAPGRGGYWIASKPFKMLPNPTLLKVVMYNYVPRNAYPAGTTLTLKFSRFILRTSSDPAAAWNLPAP